MQSWDKKTDPPPPPPRPEIVSNSPPPPHVKVVVEPLETAGVEEQRKNSMPAWNYRKIKM